METSQAAGLFAGLSLAALLVEIGLSWQALRSPDPWSQPRLGRIVLSTALVLGGSLMALIFALGTHGDLRLLDLGLIGLAWLLLLPLNFATWGALPVRHSRSQVGPRRSRGLVVGWVLVSIGLVWLAASLPVAYGLTHLGNHLCC